MEKEYLTIKEYANIKGVSPQAVYKQLSTKLSTYVEMVDGKKMLKIEVLNAEGSTKLKTEFNQVDNSVEASASTLDNDELARINKRNEEIIDDLRAQLKEKDNQIKKQNEHIVELSNKIAELFENNQKLQLNYQLLLGDGKEKENEIIEVNVDGAQAREEINEKPIKKGFFKRFFGL